jgi:hypothetical protein
MDQGGTHSLDHIQDELWALRVYYFTIWIDKRPRGIHELDEWGVLRIPGKVCSSIH